MVSSGGTELSLPIQFLLIVSSDNQGRQEDWGGGGGGTGQIKKVGPHKMDCVRWV